MLIRACRVRLGRRGNAPGRSWMLSLQRLLQRGTPACRRRQGRPTIKVRLGASHPARCIINCLRSTSFHLRPEQVQMQGQEMWKQVHLCRRFGEGSKSSNSGTDRILRQLEGSSSEIWRGYAGETHFLRAVIEVLDHQCNAAATSSLSSRAPQAIPAGSHQHVRVRRYGVFEISCWRGHYSDMAVAHYKDSIGTRKGAKLIGDQEETSSAMLCRQQCVLCVCCAEGKLSLGS